MNDSTLIQELDTKIDKVQGLLSALQAARDALRSGATEPAATPAPARPPSSTPQRATRKKGGKRRKPGAGRFRDLLRHETSPADICEQADVDGSCGGAVHRVSCSVCGDVAVDRCDNHGGRRAAANIVTGHCRRLHADHAKRVS